MKRIFAFGLLICMFFCLVACGNDNTEASTSETSGETQANETTDSKGNGFWDWFWKDVPEFEFELNDNGESYSLKTYNDLSPNTSDNVTIPSTYEGLPVTHIANSAFYACDSIKSVEIPEGIIEIGSSAFYNCTNLENINFPTTLQHIRGGAFSGCDRISSVVLPCIVSVGDSAFRDCSNLESIVLGSMDRNCRIGEYAFYGCKKLTTAKLEGASSIDSYAFQYCESLKTVMFSKHLLYIDYYAFGFCKSLETIYFVEKPEGFGSVHVDLWWDEYAGYYKIEHLS